MKKFLVLGVALIIIALSSVATAEVAAFALGGSNNRICGPKDVSELKDFSANPTDASFSTAIGGIGNYGSVLRNKTMVKNEAGCLSNIPVSLYAADEEALTQMGIELSAKDIISATLVYAGEAVGHRFSSKGNVVAQIDVADQLLNVVATDWDADGDLELALIPATKSSMGYKIGSPAVSSDNGGSEGNSNNGGNESSSSGSSTGNSGGSSSGNSGGNSVNAPDPHYRNF